VNHRQRLSLLTVLATDLAREHGLLDDGHHRIWTDKPVKNAGYLGLKVVGCTVGLLARIWVLTLSPPASAQELEPRAYSSSPTGANFLVLGFGDISGSVVFDPTLPVSNVHAQLYSPVAGLGRTFDLFGRQALVTAAWPYVWGSVQGQVFEQQHNITRSGLADLRVKFSLNLHGSPALTPQEFAKRGRQRLILGTSFTITAPASQYDRSKLISLGTNRWAFKPELGISCPWRRWYFDFYGGVWFFTENRAFYPGESTRRQDPLSSFQAHISYTLRPRMWLAFDSTWYGGGATYTNDGPPTGRQSNSRGGVTLSLPMGKRQSLKIACSRGAIVRSGENFSSLGVSWQFLWFDRHGLPIP
jgi:hypothetical protein